MNVNLGADLVQRLESERDILKEERPDLVVGEAVLTPVPGDGSIAGAYQVWWPVEDGSQTQRFFCVDNDAHGIRTIMHIAPGDHIAS